MQPSKSSTQAKTAKTNRLIDETSTYLLQHAYNPVDWYTWGPEAIAKARDENKPILLSIGYAACHWCHVMEHESFEDDATASIMNEHFVNIKVDREERTDLDEIYMKAVQMMTGHGGWPMTVFLTPELKPFFGGTYFPPEDRHGLPGFKRLLLGIADAWENQRDELNDSSDQITAHLKQLDEILPAQQSPDELTPALLEEAVERLLRIFDHTWGGFGNAPKFPHTFSLSLAMRATSPVSAIKESTKEGALELITTTLNKMAYGGIHDQIGGGFARYSVDRRWLIPHFEKMLYDNALLCQVYLEGYLLTKDTYWSDVARGILQFALRELKTDDGAFYSSLDADSEGEEGKFYVWKKEEIESLLGADAEFFCNVYGVTNNGNFEHSTNALNLSRSPKDSAQKYNLTIEEFWKKIAPMREKLMTQRSKRIRPQRDEKVLTSWNSLMISALVDGYKVLKDKSYLTAATDAARFILKNLTDNQRLLRTWGQGKAKLKGYLDDYAYFVEALLDLSEVDFEPLWFEQAQKLAGIMIEQFWDESNGGFFYTSNDHEELVTRPKSHYDGSIPSGTSVAVFDLLRLAKLTDNDDYLRKAEAVMKIYASFTARVPDQFANLLCAIDFYLSKPVEIAVIADNTTEHAEENSELALAVHGNYLPNKVVLLWDNRTKGTSPLLKGRGTTGGKPTAYVCQNFRCESPTTSPAELGKKIDALVSQK